MQTDSYWQDNMGFPKEKPYDPIGPHEFISLQLAIAGKKPCAMIDHWEFRYWAEAIKAHGWTVAAIASYKGPFKQYAVCYPGEEWRLKQLANTYRILHDTKKAPTVIQHARIGLALGYTKEEIRAFLEHIKQFE